MRFVQGGYGIMQMIDYWLCKSIYTKKLSERDRVRLLGVVYVCCTFFFGFLTSKTWNNTEINLPWFQFLSNCSWINLRITLFVLCAEWRYVLMRWALSLDVIHFRPFWSFVYTTPFRVPCCPFYGRNSSPVELSDLFFKL